MKRFTKYSLFAILSVLIIGLIDFMYSIELGEKEYLNRQYHGIIVEIRMLQFSRGIPDIKIGDEWVILDIQEQKIKNYIIVGDSIVKESGKSEIVVYRKNTDLRWIGKVFK